MVESLFKKTKTPTIQIQGKGNLTCSSHNHGSGIWVDFQDGKPQKKLLLMVKKSQGQPPEIDKTSPYHPCMVYLFG